MGKCSILQKRGSEPQRGPGLVGVASVGMGA